MDFENILHERINYDRETGKLYWKFNINGNAKKGCEAGSLTKYGYKRIHIKGNLIMAHKVVWFFEHGYIPDFPLDHVNGIRSDNRINNLMKSSYKNNNKNSAQRKDNTSGLTGVSWHKNTRKWVARIYNIEGNRITLGYFETLLDAAAARISAERKFHYSSGHGRRKSFYKNTK